MNRHDRRAWRGAATLAQIGELTAQWCEGKLTQTPAHLGPPDIETLPWLRTLAALNRTGWAVTTNSQAAHVGGWYEDTAWCAWVIGFATQEGMAWLQDAAKDEPALSLAFLEDRAWADELGLYRSRCPRARRELNEALMFCLMDPVHGRRRPLWGRLDALARRVSEHSPAGSEQ